MSTPARKLELGRVGESVRRVDAIPKVAGEFAYASDLYAAEMLWGHTVRSPHAHALITAIDTTRAAGMPGVHAVLTHEDVPGEKRYGLEFPDQPVLAFERVRYFGEPVAIVAAEHPEQARRAAERGAGRVRAARPDRRPGARHRVRADPPASAGRTATATTRIRAPTSSARSSSATAIPTPQAEVAVEGTYELGIQDQAFLGPESGLAVPDGEGGVDIYVATQWLHVDRDQVAPCLGLTPNRVRIHLAGVGGAFGGREDLSMQIHGAMLALHTNRPVKFVYNREESFVGHIHRHPARIWMRHGANRDGKLVSVQARILLDGGAYASSSTAVTSNAASFACGPYSVPNALARGHLRLHEQPALRRHARLRLRPVLLRARGADGQARRRPRARPRGAAPAKRARPRRRAPHRTGRHGLAAGRRGDPPLRRHPDPGARGAAARPDPAPGRRRQHDARRRRAPRRRLRGRLQEHLLLGGLRRLLRRARPPLHRRRRRAGRRGALGGGRGRPGRRQRHGPGGPHRARGRERRRRPAHDRGRAVRGVVLRLAADVDDRRRRPARLPRGQAGAGATRRRARARRRDQRRARLPPRRARIRSTRRPARSPTASARTWRLPARPCG